MKNLFRLILISFFLPALALAAPSRNTGLGGVALNLLEPVGLFSDFVQTGCILIGGSFLFASIIKYVEHKRSPTMVPLSTVVFLLIAGIILLLLPFLSLLTEHAIPYTFLKK